MLQIDQLSEAKRLASGWVSKEHKDFVPRIGQICPGMTLNFVNKKAPPKTQRGHTKPPDEKLS